MEPQDFFEIFIETQGDGHDFFPSEYYDENSTISEIGEFVDSFVDNFADDRIASIRDFDLQNNAKLATDKYRTDACFSSAVHKLAQEYLCK